MDNELINNKQIIPQKPVNPLTTTIITALESGDKFQINKELKQFKDANGALIYERILCMPLEDRVQGLITKKGLKAVHQTITIAITMAMETLNLSKPLSAAQIIDLTDILLDSSAEDHLSLEDILLFLQQLSRGVMGCLFSAIDIPKIMEAFDVYREKRHTEYMKIKEEKDIQHKSLGGNDSRYKKDRNLDPNTFFDLMQTYQSGRNENMD